MSKFIDKLNEKLQHLKTYLADEELSDASLRVEDIIDWIDDEQGTDLDDVLSDFEPEDIHAEFFRYFIPKGHKIIELSDINAEADFEELMQEFKQKHLLTEIY